MPYTNEQKLKEAEREVAMRRSAYPKWIKARRMTQDEADRHLDIMQEIADDYRRADAP